MFKRLRERIAEEAIRFPGQYGFNNQSPDRVPDDSTNTENVENDLITLSDSSSVVVPHTSPQQFSIAEDEDGSHSEPNTPQKKQVDCSAGPEQNFTPNSTAEESQHIVSSESQNILPKYQPSNKRSYVPQSDIESEVEEPPTLRLDTISKEQLTKANEELKAKMYKYKNKYSEVVQKYKELDEEKVKIEHTLTDSQDKALRRIAELREQCQLEQNAKAHLEENLRLILEEKEDMISVLQTKINLLKDGVNVDNAETQLNVLEKGESEIMVVKNENDSVDIEQNENSILKEKITRLQALLEKCKDTIKDNKEKMTSIMKEKESISQLLDTKSKELEEVQGNETGYQERLDNMQARLKELEQQQEESAMSMAETKKNMHEELEIKEQQLRKSKEEIRLLQICVDGDKQASDDLKKQHEEAICQLQNKLKVTEKAMEEEKQNLMQELSRGKAAAVALMQQECAKKLLFVEEEWEAKLREIQSQNEKNLHNKENEATSKLLQSEADLQKAQMELEKLNSGYRQLENEKMDLINAIESLKSTNLEADKQQAVENVEGELNMVKTTYVQDIKELKDRIIQLETLNRNLEVEKESLEVLQVNMEAELKQLKLDLVTTISAKETECESAKKENKYQVEQLSVLKETMVKTEAELRQSKLDLASTINAKDTECESLRAERKKQDEQLSVLKETIKDRENIILQLKSTVSSTEVANHEKIHELSNKIKQLELEQEKLMLQAQERVSATEAKCRQDVNQLTEKIGILQAERTDIESLKSEIKVLNSQLDESLLVAEANRLASATELSSFKTQLNGVQKQLADTLKAHSVKECELLNKLKKLETENLEYLENSKCLKIIKEEKELLNQKVRELESKTCSDSIMDEINLLKEENTKLHKEVELFAPLKEEKELLNGRIQTLESNKEDLCDKINLLQAENCQLQTSISDQKDSVTNLNCVRNELALLKEENLSLLNKISLLEKSTFSDPNSATFKQYVELIKSEFEGKLSMKDTEMENKLKQLVKDFCAQMNVKDKDYDQIIAEVVEKCQCQEEKLLRDHRLEIASLRQDIFEKDCALEEMREHYEEVVQEKDTKLKEYESNVKSANSSNFYPNAEARKSEHSDWDDGWVVCEENIENSSPVDGNKSECVVHSHQIEELQEELAKCNSEIKDLRILLRLSPPQSLSSNNNYSNSSSHIPEPTEFEYLRNILFEYMMGKETLTLVKVIAAVLRFSEEQTQLVMQKEELKQAMK